MLIFITLGSASMKLRKEGTCLSSIPPWEKPSLYHLFYRLFTFRLENQVNLMSPMEHSHHLLLLSNEFIEIVNHILLSYLFPDWGGGDVFKLAEDSWILDVTSPHQVASVLSLLAETDMQMHISASAQRG